VTRLKAEPAACPRGPCAGPRTVAGQPAGQGARSGADEWEEFSSFH
jgi:hypothetical protein